MRFSIPFLTLVLVAACSDNPVEKIHISLPDNVRFLKLEPTTETNSRSIVANGANKIQFKITAFDQDKNQLYFVKKDGLTLLINDTDELAPPYSFSTDQPDNYRFTIKDVNSSNLLNSVVITAVAPPDLREIVFPLIFHVVTSNRDPIWANQYARAVQDSLVKLNAAFGNKLKSTDPNALDSRLRFTLAETDPNGSLLPHKGLNIIYSDRKDFGDYPDIKKIQEFIMDGNFWPLKKYINVWVLPVTIPFALGGSGDGSKNSPITPQGPVVIDLSVHTMAHELGHVFGLQHVFSFGCFDGDFCTDTWPYSRYEGYIGRVPIAKKSCTGETFLSNNFMDYPTCQYNTFTLQQVVRMHKIIELYPLFYPTDDKEPKGGRTIQEPGVFGFQKATR